jgi:hypothetical protein
VSVVVAAAVAVVAVEAVVASAERPTTVVVDHTAEHTAADPTAAEAAMNETLTIALIPCFLLY